MRNKYIKKGISIQVDLYPTEFSIMALMLKTDNQNNYKVTLFLKRYDIPHWDTMDEQQYEIQSDNINLDTYKFIIDKYKNKDFNHFMEQYDYEVKMIDEQIDVAENKTVNVSPIIDEYYSDNMTDYWDPAYWNGITKK